MRPDVAAAFDRMAAAARRAGLSLVVNSGFRSDAEQAALFAAHPDPPGWRPRATRCTAARPSSTSGPTSAYGWLAANAGRFGFVQRYSWEAWHYGYDAGPAPCSAAGELGRRRRAATAPPPAGGGLPRVRPGPVPRRRCCAAAARWNVSAALLAAQLMAESNFNPFAVSPGRGRRDRPVHARRRRPPTGSTTRSTPVAAIDAQAHLMSDLLRQFGSPALALAAYNAGPGAGRSLRLRPRDPRDPGLRRPHPRPDRRRRRPGRCPACSRCGWSSDAGDGAGRRRSRRRCRPLRSGIDELRGADRQATIGPSDWVEVTQEDIDKFAEVSARRPVDPRRRRAGRAREPVRDHGRPRQPDSVADRRLPHELISAAASSWASTTAGTRSASRPRCPPARRFAGRRSRLEVEELGDGWYHVVTRFTLEREGGEKPGASPSPSAARRSDRGDGRRDPRRPSPTRLRSAESTTAASLANARAALHLGGRRRLAIGANPSSGRTPESRRAARRDEAVIGRPGRCGYRASRFPARSRQVVVPRLDDRSAPSEEELGRPWPPGRRYLFGAPRSTVCAVERATARGPFRGDDPSDPPLGGPAAPRSGLERNALEHGDARARRRPPRRRPPRPTAGDRAAPSLDGERALHAGLAVAVDRAEVRVGARLEVGRGRGRGASVITSVRPTRCRPGPRRRRRGRAGRVVEVDRHVAGLAPSQLLWVKASSPSGRLDSTISAAAPAPPPDRCRRSPRRRRVGSSVEACVGAAAAGGEPDGGEDEDEQGGEPSSSRILSGGRVTRL